MLVGQEGHLGGGEPEDVLGGDVEGAHALGRAGRVEVALYGIGQGEEYLLSSSELRRSVLLPLRQGHQRHDVCVWSCAIECRTRAPGTG